MTHRHARLARVLLVAAPLCLSLLVALGARFTSPGFSSPGELLTLLELRGEPELLASRLADLPVRIRLGGDGWALVEVANPDLERVEAEFPVHSRLLQAAGPLHLAQVRDSELDADERAELESRTVYHQPSEDLRVFVLPPAGEPAEPGAGLLVARLRSGHGHAHPLPAAMPARSLGPLPAAELANPYRQSRLGDPAARARALALAGDVDAARIEQMVRDLSAGPGATRYAGRGELHSYAMPLLVDSLRAIFSAPGDTVFTQPFIAHVDSTVGDVELYNIIARRPGQRPGSGRYVLGGHYDSIARRTEGWDPATQPAPGADDNASGTACVIEAARVLTQDSYDFDLEVALFSGEEQVLLGSKAYADDPEAEIEEVLGAIILDMVGYNPRAADSLNVLTNFTSEWLADLMRVSESALGGTNGLDEFDKEVRPTLTYSDHASFWSHGASAVLLIENTEIVAHNPNYHRVTDTIDNLIAVDGPDLMRRTTEVVVATLGQFAISAVPVVSFDIPPTGLLFYDEDGRFSISAVVGEMVESRTRVLNTGAFRPGPVTVHAALSVGGVGAAERDTSFVNWGSGIWHDVVVRWHAARSQVGNQIVVSELTLRENGTPVDLLSDSAAFEIDPLLARDVMIVPNPVRGSLADGQLRLRLTGGADLRSWVLDVVGTEVGRLDRRLTSGTSTIALADIVEEPDLPSGTYLLRYELRAPDGGGLIGDDKLAFAYMR